MRRSLSMGDDRARMLMLREFRMTMDIVSILGHPCAD
jgi:hypothetical protein